MSRFHCTTEVVKPDRVIVRQYAGEVSARLAAKYDDQTETRFTAGLSEFLDVVATIQARRLSESGAAHG